MIQRTSAILSVLVLLIATAAAGKSPPRGHLVLVGGGEKPAEAMKKFIELAGGKDAPIAVVPTASTEADTAQYYIDLFKKELGCSDVVVLPIVDKADALKPEVVAAAARARGVFFGGGDQVRITNALLGTPTLDAIRAVFSKGGVIGGTSAGLACQSRLMITGEGDFKVIREGAVEIKEGLGFLDDVILDQHFIARQRSNRLMTVLLEHPDHLGVAVDEDTAIWIRPDLTFDVMGDSSVMVLDAKGSAVTKKAAGKGGGLLGVRGMRVHILVPGQTFDLSKRDVVVRETAKAAR